MSFPGWAPRFVAALDRLSIPSRQRARGSHPGNTRSAIRGRALEFADYRPYVPGDDPRLVDWRAYARFDRLFLKQHEEERSRTVRILVDVSASMDWGDGQVHKGRFVRQLAAALAWIAASHHEAVAVWLLRDGAAQRLASFSNRAGAVGCFRELEAVREGGHTGLGSAVGQALLGSYRGPTFLISDLLDPPSSSSSASGERSRGEGGWHEALTAMSRTGEGVVLQVLAPAEWVPPVGEEVELLDAESGETLATRLGTPELERYARELEAFLSRVKEECRRLGLAYLALDTGTALQDVLFRQFPAAGILE